MNDVAFVLDHRAPPPRVEEAAALGLKHGGGLGKVPRRRLGGRMLGVLGRSEEVGGERILTAGFCLYPRDKRFGFRGERRHVGEP